MTYQIDDFDEIYIYITTGWTEWYIPKFRIYMVIDEPYLYIHWVRHEVGGSVNKEDVLKIDYADVTLGYGGSTPSSAAELESVIEGYIVSAWTNITPPTIPDIISPLLLMGG